jgi:hypothetical protein
MLVVGQRLYQRWTHRLTAVIVWNATTAGLTARLLRLLFGPGEGTDAVSLSMCATPDRPPRPPCRNSHPDPAVRYAPSVCLRLHMHVSVCVCVCVCVYVYLSLSLCVCVTGPAVRGPSFLWTCRPTSSSTHGSACSVRARNQIYIHIYIERETETHASAYISVCAQECNVGGLGVGQTWRAIRRRLAQRPSWRR